jgi:hypothetical protein
LVWDRYFVSDIYQYTSRHIRVKYFFPGTFFLTSGVAYCVAYCVAAWTTTRVDPLHLLAICCHRWTNPGTLCLVDSTIPAPVDGLCYQGLI